MPQNQTLTGRATVKHFILKWSQYRIKLDSNQKPVALNPLLKTWSAALTRVSTGMSIYRMPASEWAPCHHRQSPHGHGHANTLYHPCIPQVGPWALSRSLHHGGCSGQSTQRSTLESRKADFWSFSFMDYSATAYKEMNCGANCNKGTIRPMTLTERKRDLCGLLCHEAWNENLFIFSYITLWQK